MPSIDLLGEFLKNSGHFRGKGKATNFWLRRVSRSRDIRSRALPGEGTVRCDLSIPYEAMVWLGWEEQKDLEILTRLLRPSQTFVDCGANIGIWSIVAASAVGSTGKVFAFEPNPSTADKLRYNVSHGKWEQVMIVPMAASNADTEVYFRCEPEHNNSHIVGNDNNNAIKVPVVTLDGFLPGEVSGCKIDVEGFEMNVLQGAKTLLKKEHPWLCIEFNTLLANVNRLKDWNVHTYLRDLGYVARRFQDALDISKDVILPDDWQTEGYCNLFYSMVG